MIRSSYIRILFIGLFIGLLSSCEGSLEPETFDKLSPSIYPKTAEDARTAITGAYQVLNQGWAGYGGVGWQGRLIINEATTDEFVCYWGGSVWETYAKILWTANSDHVNGQTYFQYIKATSNCVNLIDQIKTIAITADLKTRYEGEMRGLMALLGYTMYDFYGPVPIVLDSKITSNPTSDFQPERPTKEWMVSYIKEQARLAANVLPVSYGKADYGRITKGTALMVLLKLAMHEKDWAEAAKISKEMMDLKYYGLQSSYLSVFAVDNEMNNELVFAIPLAVKDGNVWLAHVLVGDYVEPNGIPIQAWGGYKVPWNMYDKFEEGKDERLKSLWRYLNTKNGIIDMRADPNHPNYKLGALPYKYSADPASNGERHGNDYVVFRWADVLLLRAEALNNLNGPTQESIDLIMEVRNRAKATAITLVQFSDKQSLNDYILDERFRELFMEGHRREDLIRNGKYLTEAIKRGAAYTDATRLLFPLPQKAIDENPKIKQNPGY